MNLDTTLDLLWTFGLIATVPAALLLLAGPLLRRHLDPGAVYAAWLLVPVTVIAAAIGKLAPEVATQAVTVLPAVGIAAETFESAAGAAAASWTSALWALGTLTLLMLFLAQQSRFARKLALATPMTDNVVQGDSPDAGPALVGVLKPRILLPSDFAKRYTPEQQDLILLHERIHQRRGDAWVNLAVAGCQALFWFNPIVHLAARRIRRDQELACDAAVIARHPRSAKAYAEAMLSTQLAVLGLPAGCHWQSSHPLKERLIMLTRHSYTRSARILGIALLLASGLALAGAGIATQADLATEFDEAPSYATMSPPKYPKSALDAKIAGQVMLKVGIDATGKPVTIDIVSTPDAAIGKAASEAVASWTFNPAKKAGKPVPSIIQVPIDFSLDETAAAPGEAAPASNTLDSLTIRGG